jgi:hypothetical protein
MARRHTLGWSQAPGWGQAFPGWEPLADPGPLPLRAAGSLARWWWPISAIAGFLTVVGYVLVRDNPRPGLSNRGWLTVVLAAVVVLLLTVHRAGRGRPPRADPDDPFLASKRTYWESNGQITRRVTIP